MDYQIYDSIYSNPLNNPAFRICYGTEQIWIADFSKSLNHYLMENARWLGFDLKDFEKVVWQVYDSGNATGVTERYSVSGFYTPVAGKSYIVTRKLDMVDSSEKQVTEKESYKSITNWEEVSKPPAPLMVSKWAFEMLQNQFNEAISQKESIKKELNNYLTVIAIKDGMIRKLEASKLDLNQYIKDLLEEKAVALDSQNRAAHALELKNEEIKRLETKVETQAQTIADYMESNLQLEKENSLAWSVNSNCNCDAKVSIAYESFRQSSVQTAIRWSALVAFLCFLACYLR